MIKPLIILDRDGVINLDSDDYIRSAEQWLPIDSSIEAISALTKADYHVAIATNQSGLSRNYFTIKTLSEIHQKMLKIIQTAGGNISAIEFCADHPDKAGPNRKPAPGMLIKLIDQFNVKAEETWFIGDSISDIDCANNANCKPALVLTGKGVLTKHSADFDLSVPVFNDLLAFTNWLLSSKI